MHAFAATPGAGVEGGRGLGRRVFPEHPSQHVHGQQRHGHNDSEFLHRKRDGGALYLGGAGGTLVNDTIDGNSASFSSAGVRVTRHGRDTRNDIE
jgi:hypothetical protein